MEHGKQRFLVRGLRPLHGAAYAYPLTLLVLSVAFVRIGEHHWLTAGALYVPRALWLLPLVVLTPALLLTSSKKLLWTQGAALLLGLFPLLGLVMPWPTPAARGPTLRLLSYNVDTARAGSERLLEVVDRLSPDVVLFQESPANGPLLDGLRARYAHFDSTSQFLMASRYPILERTAPEPPPRDGLPHLQRHMRYVVATDFGPLAIYSVHPVSPRGTLGVERLLGATRLPHNSSNPMADLAQNARLREAQIAEVASLARLERDPVVLAGDTNLPGLSAALHRHLGGYVDGFQAASWGFGYTFPARHPFLRLDRILAGSELGFERFAVGCPAASDHCWVWARLFRR
jgi:endonuclease/exonuclease/phosphatase family metal-dependent hydrolase